MRAEKSASQVAEHWSRILEEADAFGPEVYWLAVPEIARHFTLRATAGARTDSWVNWCVAEFLEERKPVGRMLSVGCGNGALERHLALLGAYRECDAWDIAPGAVETARRLAREQGIEGLRYEVRDANTAELPADWYDAIWFHGSLHHIEALERICGQVARSLKPDGLLFLSEYVGPDVFDLTPRQKEVIRAAFDLIPPRYRRALGRAGQPAVPRPAIPDPAEVVAADPSEAVRSSEILKLVRQHFDVIACNPAGGTVLQFLLHGIAGNFRASDPDSIKVLDLLLRLEDTLIDVGDLESDFVVLVARQREPGASPGSSEAAGSALGKMKSLLLSLRR